MLKPGKLHVFSPEKRHYEVARSFHVSSHCLIAEANFCHFKFDGSRCRRNWGCAFVRFSWH